MAQNQRAKMVLHKEAVDRISSETIERDIVTRYGTKGQDLILNSGKKIKVFGLSEIDKVILKPSGSMDDLTMDYVAVVMKMGYYIQRIYVMTIEDAKTIARDYDDDSGWFIDHIGEEYRDNYSILK